MENNREISFLQLIPETFRFIKYHLEANIVFFIVAMLMYIVNLVFYFQSSLPMSMTTYASPSPSGMEVLKLLGIQLIVFLVASIIGTGFVGYFTNAARSNFWTASETIAESLTGFWRLLVATLGVSIVLWLAIAIPAFVTAFLALIPVFGWILAIAGMIAVTLFAFLFSSSFIPVYIIEVIHKKNILDSVTRTLQMLKGHKLRLAGTLLLMGFVMTLPSLLLMIPTVMAQAASNNYTALPQMTGTMMAVSIVSLVFGLFMYNYMILAHYYLDKGMNDLSQPDKYDEQAYRQDYP
jgi:hypothetical protein